MSSRFLTFAPVALLVACNAPASSGSAGPTTSDNQSLAVTPAPATAETAASNSGENQAQKISGGMPVPPNPGNDCANATGSNFNAWVNAMPGPGRKPKLIVTGTVTTPSAGYRILFTGVRVAESDPVQITAELGAVPPSGSAPHVVTRTDVRGEWSSETRVGSVTVRCGVKTIARISPVETAQ